MADRLAIFLPGVRSDLRWWVETHRGHALKLLDLIEAVLKDPHAGIGKPEPLRGNFAGMWSRRISDEHRLVYRVQDDRVLFVQARFHY